MLKIAFPSVFISTFFWGMPLDSPLGKGFMAPLIDAAT